MREDNTQIYSDDEIDFIRLFPDTSDPMYLEPVLKIINETKRHKESKEDQLLN